MNPSDLLHAMKNSEADHLYLQEIQEKLSVELEKPVSEQNFDLIDEYTQTIALMTDTEELITQRTKVGIEQLSHTIDIQREQTRRHLGIHKLFAFVAACIVVVILAGNIWSQAALGMNVFSAAYKVFNSDIVIDLRLASELESDAEKKKDYGSEIQRICEEQGFSPKVPSYFPDGFQPSPDIYGDTTQTDEYSVTCFYFLKGKKKLNISYWLCEDETKIPPYGIPTESYEINEEIIHGVKVHITKNKNNYQAFFLIDKIIYSIYADELDYDECYKVLLSIFEE